MDTAADHPLKQIQESVAHRLSLKLWEKEELVLNRRIEQKETRRRNIQNEIYQLLGLYFVFLGVVLTAIFQAGAQPSHKTCKCWWSPFFLTAIALVVTLGGVHKKFHLQSEIQNQVEEEKENSKALFQSIQRLRAEGTRFDLNAERPSTKSHQEPPLILRAADWGYWWGYRGLVTLLLIAFSAIVLVSCRSVLCLSSKPSKP
ncbi:hypothetical protein SUGI_0049580 [Cryptomeria japonica]|uniref:uncharacterized protein LOC131069104 n=1 Tax=Cryptomeria japonica TaxID=3369 RepID=UPI002408D598|nr:uncharacterized protein LOC131069104 [Cryptomeria japonica]GLJ06831.1 hypothetical protein SUGI_0049580 [Cryptomeria japonica]